MLLSVPEGMAVVRADFLETLLRHKCNPGPADTPANLGDAVRRRAAQGLIRGAVDGVTIVEASWGVRATLMCKEAAVDVAFGWAWTPDKERDVDLLFTHAEQALTAQPPPHTTRPASDTPR